jgi:hypothetical protein
MKVKNLKEHLKKHYNDSDDIAYAIWSKEDVEDQATKKSVELTDEEIANTLELIHEHDDAEYGISWTTVDCAIDEILSRRGNSKAK